MKTKFFSFVAVPALQLLLVANSWSRPLDSGAGYALLYDGLDDHVTVADHPSLDLSSAITIEAWINKQANVQWASILTKGAGRGNSDFPPNNYALLEDSMGRFIFTSELGILAQSSMSIPLNEWHHIAMTWDGASIKFYFDGVLDAAAVTPFVGTLPTNDSTLVIGADFPGDDEYFAGCLDEVRLWKVARTEAELQADLHKALRGNEPGLAGYWRFDEGTGAIAHDLSGNHNHGKLLDFNFDNTSGWVSKGVFFDRIVSVVNVSASPGNMVEVPIEFAALGNENALQFSVQFDPAILKQGRARLGKDSCSASLQTDASQLNSGRLGFRLVLPNGLSFANGLHEILVVSFLVDSATTARSKMKPATK